MIFRRLLDPDSSNCICVPGDIAYSQAMRADPSCDLASQDVAILMQPGVEMVCMLEFHIHAEHVVAAGVQKGVRGGATFVSRRRAANPFDWLLDNDDAIRSGVETLPLVSTPGQSAGTSSNMWRNRLHGGLG